MINAFCLIALSKYKHKQFNFNFSECCYLKNKNKTQKQNKRQLQSNIHTEVWPMRGRWWRTQKCLKCHLISKANLRWFYPALPRNRFRGPRDQGVAGDVSENVPCPTTLASNLISPYDLDCPWRTWIENIITRCVLRAGRFIWTHVSWIVVTRTVRPSEWTNSLKKNYMTTYINNIINVPIPG